MGAEKREALTMQEPNEHISFRREKGCFLSTGTIGLLTLVFLGSLVAVGLLVHYLAAPAAHGGEIGDAEVAKAGTQYFVIDQESGKKGDTSVATKKKARPDVRLPKSLIPVHYLVKLIPYINGNFSIHGYVEATFKVMEETSKVMIHINAIETLNDTIKLISAHGDTIPIKKHSWDPVREFYIATLGNNLKMGEKYTLAMHYIGYLNEDLDGFYRSSYKGDNGETRWLATTQFQPTDARKAFPCFDEPGLKANFTIHMAREDGMTAISNMPVEETVPRTGHPGWVWDHFETSVPMSTYLVAFIVSDFAYLESPNSPNYKFRVWARKSAITQAEYAIKIGPPVSQYLEKFFQVPFPLPKQDMAALPDFSAGAMENWGLITYRETAMLYDPKVARAKDKEYLGIVVAHELAHQWFGNLVTPYWWTDLWLNEGFASYVEYLGLNAVEPTFKMMEQFVIIDIHSVFGLDCLESSHPINIPVEHPDEINEIFDRISYSKGASIIRMMSHFLTEETFRNGLTKYLEGKKYQSATQDDLWHYLTLQGHEDGTMKKDMTVKTIMDTWTLQMGYPVITVDVKGDGSAMLSQERFLLVRSANSTDTHDYKWWVPITYTTGSGPNFENTQPSDWMSPNEATKTITGLPSNRNSWVIFNIQETGYYRVNYNQENWDAITNQLLVDHTVISTINRAQIINDALTLSRAGLLPYETSLKILSYLKNEDEYVPWAAALGGLNFIDENMQFSGGYGSFQDYMLTLIVPMYNKIGFADSTSDPHLDQKKRSLILSYACDLGHRPCIDESIKLYNQWMANPEANTIISPNLKSIVFCHAIAEGSVKEWQFAWERYEKSNVASEKSVLLQAMGCSKELWILSGYLNRAIKPDAGIRKQDARTVIAAVASHDIGKAPAWEFVRDQWTAIIDYYGSVAFTLKSIIKSTTLTLNSRNQLNELMAFQKSNEGKLSSAKRAVDQSIEHVQNNIAWTEKNYLKILSWLKDNGFDNNI